MKKFLRIALVLVVCLAGLQGLFAANPPLLRAPAPVLITCFGQNPDGNFVNLLSRRSNIENTYLTAIPVREANWNQYKTLIAVIGGSGKGLGSAGLNVTTEIQRCEQLIESARRARVPVIGMHIGGEDRRGPNSEPFLSLAGKVDYLIVKSNGNADGYFTRLAAANNIPLYTVETTAEIQNVLRQIFLGE
jgi:hypothetical protein